MPSYSGSASTFNSFTGRFNLLGSFASGQFQEDTPAENSESQVIIKCHNNPAALEVFQEAKNVHASTYRDSLLMELTNSIFVDLEGLSNDIMTDLPYDADEMLELISSTPGCHKSNKGKKLLYNNRHLRWTGWPKTDERGTEHKLSKYLNVIADTVRERLGRPESPDDLVFSATVYKFLERTAGASTYESGRKAPCIGMEYMECV